jgi:hypothetical protein
MRNTIVLLLAVTLNSCSVEEMLGIDDELACIELASKYAEFYAMAIDDPNQTALFRIEEAKMKAELGCD